MEALSDLRFPALAPTSTAEALRVPSPPAAITWRYATVADIPFLRRLYGELRADELAGVAWLPTLKQAFLDQQFVLQHHHYTTYFPCADFLVIEQAVRAIGRLYLDRQAHDWCLIDIGLLASVRGRGVGTALIGHLQSLASTRGVGLSLHVQLDNQRARALYERLGFQAGVRTGHHLAMRFPPRATVS
ncbi:MAG TPA: GNAT family N-acetyltransferase [Rhodanobacteraceae bacterium]